jgi:YD repeat-containing protein
MSVQRQYYDETFAGPPQEGIADFQTSIYASDRGVALASQSPPADYDRVSGLTLDGTYLVTYEFTGGTVDSQNPGFICQFRLTRSGGGSLITVERRTTFEPNFVFEGSGSGSEVFLAPNMDVAVYSNTVAAQPGGVDGMEDKIPGTWNVVRSMSGPTNPPPTPDPVRTFTLRLLALKNIRAEEPKFDPKSERNYTEVKADVVALPVGWLPTGNISARLEVSAYGPVNVAIVEQDLTLFAAPGANGEVAEFLLRWDGTLSGQKEPAEGLFQAVARVIAATGIGTTKAVSKDVFVTAASCSCDCETKPTGNRKMSWPLNGLPGCPVGPSFHLNLDYCTVNSGKPASSMGFGWQGKSTCRIFEPPGQNGSVSYRSETGTYLRWNLQGSDYVPAFADNYVELVKNASEPIYVLTFQDQSVREFNLEGRLVRERDRNGNPLSYVYDLVTGDLAQMTDATGQSIFFDYSGRTDGQPRYIRSLDAVAGRTIELQYDANARLEYVIQNGDGAPEITQFVYNAEGLVETTILPSGLRPVTSVYDILGRVVVELYTPAATPDGFESVKEIFYEQDAIDLGAYFGLNLGGKNVVASLVTDLTDNASPGRLTFATYDLLGNMVQRDELVFWATPPSESRFNTTLLEYNDPNNPHLVTRQIMPNGFTLTMTYNVQGNVSSVNESYSDTTTIYRYTEDVDSPPFNPKWQNLLREIHRPTVTVDGVPTTYPPTVFTYEPTYGNLVGVQDAAGKSIVMQVSSDGLVEAVTDRRNQTTTMAYHLTSRRLESVTTPGGPNGAPSRTTSVTYDAYLNIQTITSPTLPAAQFTHDEQNRSKRSTTPLGFYAESSYLNGLLNQVELPANQGSATLLRGLQR